MDKFKSMEDLEQFIEENISSITAEPEFCYMCGCTLHTNEGWTEYVICDEVAPDDKFCDIGCLKNFLLDKVGIEESEDE